MSEAYDVEETKNPKRLLLDMLRILTYFYSFRQLEKKLGFPMNEKMAFWLLFGAVVHELLTPVIAEALGGEREVRTVYEYDGIEIYGTADVLAPDVVVELKTCNRLPERPYKSHLEQLNAYMHFFDRPKGLVIYISRMQLGIRTFEYYGDMNLLLDTLATPD